MTLIQGMRPLSEQVETKLIVVVPFLNEAGYLEALLDSIADQQRLPDRLILVDDGSTDNSGTIAEDFAATHAYTTVLHRPQQAKTKDRLATASELKAFHWAVDQIAEPHDVLAKLDADLRLPSATFATLIRQFAADPTLGIAGAYLSVKASDGKLKRERCPAGHVRGATKFYRRACYDQISPLPPMLGWDTIDEARARMRGWRTATFDIPGGDIEHLRPTGAYNGALRGFRRAGVSAYAYGAHPFYVALGSVSRMRRRPRVVGGLHFIVGWAGAALHRVPRAEPELQAFVRCEQMRRIGQMLTGPFGRYVGFLPSMDVKNPHGEKGRANQIR